MYQFYAIMFGHYYIYIIALAHHLYTILIILTVSCELNRGNGWQRKCKISKAEMK